MARGNTVSRSYHVILSRSWHVGPICRILVTMVIMGFQSAAIASDFRIISFKELTTTGNTKVYNYEGAHDFSQLTIDTSHRQLLVGAVDTLIRLDMSTLHQLEKSTWQADTRSIEKCLAHGQSSEVCHNYMRVLLLHGDRAFTCGTHAFSPTCTWRSVTNMSHVIETVPGVAKCPYHPHHNSSALMTREGDLYSSTVTDYAAGDPVIYRMLGPSKHLRTDRRNSLWLNEPNFISSYEIDDYIYFFFRESAVEYINCGKSIYSRVARVCKSDMGGQILLKDNWTTFVKARLNCSLPGAYPFYFSELQSTYLLEEQQLIYAVFTTAPTSIYGSAVCVYNTSSFNTAFNGPFKYQANAQMAWTSMPRSFNSQCSSAEANDMSESNLAPTPSHRYMLESQKYQIMDNSVQPAFQVPVVVAENERFTHLAVDEIRTKHHDVFRVLFVITLEGVVKKFITLPGTNQNCLVEEIHITPTDLPQAARSFKLDQKESVLFVGTNDSVYRIPTQRCHRFTSKRACLNAQDPYCGWNSNYHSCTRAPFLPDHAWHQDIASCPILQSPVDGGWSEWSAWETCDQNSFTDDKCMCKSRSCDSPAPQHGGQPCPGNRVQVANCTVHGGWSDWSEWSSCTSSCGLSSRGRSRSCTNPKPAHNGRHCAGASVDTVQCHMQACPEPLKTPLAGSWSKWSHWSLCDKNCDGGVRNRSRACTDPPPYNGGAPCVGNDVQWEKCNTHTCSMLRKSSSWAPWVEYNRTQHGFSRTRYRFVCRAHVSDQSKLNVFVKPQDQYCVGSTCGNSGPLEVLGWSRWSSWTTCDKLCDGGVQSRERICEGGQTPGGCIGHSREIRHCNQHSCQGSWSCWGEFSPCSVSCGTGRQWRRRDCVAETAGKHYTIACTGDDHEERVCDKLQCDTSKEGWKAWNTWSLCEKNNEQRRFRSCIETGPDKCPGPKVEIRACTFNSQDPIMGEVRYDGTNGSKMSGSKLQVYHLVIVGIVGFILGGLVCVGIFFYCQRQQRQNSQQKFASLPRCQHTPPNEYMTHADLDLLRPISPPTPLNNQFYSSTSLQRIKKENMRNMTVKEASQRHSDLLRSNSMRTSCERVYES